jgi:pilus assembly protein CpaF
MGHLLMSALRLRPDRIVVGEVRGGEAFDLVQAMNTGHGGSMATVHANTPTDSLRRLESLCLMSAVELPMVAVRAQVASAINFVVCCERLQDGSRKTIAISEVLPLNEKGDYRTQDLFLYIPVSKDENGKILGYHAPTGILPTFMAKARAYGFEDLTPEFFDPRTYGVPPPPLIHGLGESITTHWAPSLKHREKGQPDPDEYHDEWKAFEAKLKADAKAKNAEKSKVQVQVPAGPTPQAAPPPAQARAPQPPSRPAMPAQRPPPSAAPARDDATPPPTRNPLMARKPAADPLRETGDEAAQEPEASIEVSEELFEESSDPNSTTIRPNPLAAGRKPPAPGSGPRPGVKPPPKR